MMATPCPCDAPAIPPLSAQGPAVPPRCLAILIAGQLVVGCGGWPAVPTPDPVPRAAGTDTYWSEAQLEEPEPPEDRAPSGDTPASDPTGRPDAPERFDVWTQDLPATVFYTSLVRDTAFGMVVDPGIDGEISLALRGVTVEEALAATRSLYGHEFQRRGNTYLVYPATLQTEVFQLDYPSVQRIGRSVTPVVGSGTGIEPDHQRGAIANPAGAQGTIETATASDPWGTLQAVLGHFVDQTGDAEVVIDRLAGLIVVRAMPDELRAVRAYLTQAQQALVRQVLLEARIIEITLDEGFQAGIDWSTLADHGHRIGIAMTRLDAGLGSRPAAGAAFDPRGDATIQSSFATDVGGLLTAGFVGADFAGLIRLLATQGQVRVLSSPRVATLNNQKAVIKAGSNAYFVTDVRSHSGSVNTQDDSRSVPGVDITLTPFFSGVSLDVTPQISGSSEVILHVRPSVTEVSDQTRNLVVAGNPQSLPLARSSLREIDAVVRARDGEVIILGGLMQELDREHSGRTPFLSRIPLLGGLFRQDQRQELRSELVILLRARVQTVPTAPLSAPDSDAIRAAPLDSTWE